jgi:hypothetical protein
MNPYELAALSRERQRALRAEAARGDVLAIALRAGLARALRASGDRLFRLGVALDERVPAAPAVEPRA